MRLNRNLCAAWLALLALGPGQLGAATTLVRLVNYAFQPQYLTNQVGDTVLWTNTTTTFHDVVSSNNSWTASALFASPGTFPVTFNSPGAYGYYCSPHQSLGMTGIIYVRAANQPPVVAVTNPPSGATFTAPATFTIQASASDPDGTVANVQFYTNNVLLGSDATSPYSITAGGLGTGTYILTARATDNGGLITISAPVTITVNAPNQPPVVALTNPPAGRVLAAPASIVLGASASDPDGTVASVQFFSGTTNLGAATTIPYAVTVNNLTAGTYNFTASVLDNGGLRSTSSVVSVSVVTPALARFSTNLSLVSGGLPLRLSVTPGLSYAIEYSVTLTNWTPWTNFLATNSIMVFSAPTTTTNRRFFRSRLLPNP